MQRQYMFRYSQYVLNDFYYMLPALNTVKKTARFPNSRRENEGEEFFNTSHKSLSVLATIIIPAIYTPALILDNLMSHGILFSLGNISLAAGFCIYFTHRMIAKNISYLELFASLVLLGALLTVAFSTAPMTLGFTLVQSINFLNLVSTSINSFLLISPYVIPHFQALIKYTFTFLGHELQTSFFSSPPLTLKEDGPVIDRLLKKHYKHDSFSPDFNEDEIKPFNALIQKMVMYINKYQEPFFGTVIEEEKIKQLKTAITALVKHGNTDSSFAFINEKIDFKTHKINRIKRAIDTCQTKEKEHKASQTQLRHGFFRKFRPTYELSELQEELLRQEEKVASLKLCLPCVP